MAWMEEIRAARENHSRPEHPWRTILETIRGDIGHDGVERIATDRVFDLLDVKNDAAAGIATANASSAARCVRVMKPSWAARPKTPALP